MLLSHLLIGGFFIIICDLRLSYATEPKNKSSASEELLTDVELEETRRLIQEGADFVKLGPERDIVLLLGITGAGKSTLGLLLSGDNRNLTAVESSPRSGKFYIQDTNHRISSQSQLLSQTIFPEKFVDYNGAVYYDCPGFGDTRSLAHDVSVSHFIRRVIDYAERLKLLLVVSQDSLEGRSTFVDLILDMASYTHNINAFRDGIALIVTKVKQTLYEDDDGNYHAVTDEVEILGIAKYLTSVKKTIQDSKRNSTHISAENHKKFELAAQYIDILLQKNGDKYTKIGIFRSPSKAGSLDKNKSIQKNKLDLKNLIENNLKFTVKNASDFTLYTVSEKARYSIEKSVGNLTQRIEIELQNVAAHFNDFYNKLEHKPIDLLQFTDEIRQHVQIWNSFQNNYGDNVIDFSNQLRTTIQQLKVTFCEENLKKLSKQTEYINMWISVLPDLELIYDTQAIIWKSVLEPFQERVIATMHWYETLLKFNQLLASYEVQSQRTQLVQIYGYRNANRYNQLQAFESSVQLDSNIVQNQLKVLSVDTSNHRKSILNDIWDYNMQPVEETFDSETNTLRIHGFLLKLSDARKIITSTEFNGVKNFEIFAIDSIFIDDDIILTNNNNLVIIAPVWIVKGSRTINLNGTNAENYSRHAEMGYHGLPGRAGQSAGNFLGVAFEIKNFKMLSISSFGGNGGDGQNGGPGRNGIKGDDGEFYFKKQYLLPFSWGKSEGYRGTPGTVAGDGGAGGYGGYCGDVQLVHAKLSKAMFSIPSCVVGKRGANGQGGPGGQGGQYGDTVTYGCAVFCLFNGDIDRKINYNYAKNGANGVAGRNTDNMLNAVQTPPIKKDSAVNNYKLFLSASLSEFDKPNRKNILKIKNLNEKLDNNNIPQFYGVIDFVDNLIKLDNN